MDRLRPSSLETGRLLLAVFAAALGSVVLAGGARAAGYEPGLIAFTRSDGIYVMRQDGTGVRPLRRGGAAASAYGLDWSPDGRRLVFASYGSGAAEIWVMNADGSRPVRLVSGSALMSPTWSSDGRTIAYTTYADGNRDIWMVNADGSRVRRLARTPTLFELDVDWSPGGGRLAFSTDGYFPHLYAMRTSGRDLRRLTPRGMETAGPRWSPDGRRIVFMRLGESNLEDEIYVLESRGRARVQLTRNHVMDYAPVWSPDGSSIAFLRSTGESCWFQCPVPRRGSSEIYVMNADGTNVKRLTTNAVAEGSLAWQSGAAP